MSSSPPPSPEKTLARVLQLATCEGWIAMVVGAGGALFFLVAIFDLFSILVGSAIAGCAAVGLRGVKLLKQGDSRGMNLLVRSQLLVILTISVYAAISLFIVTPASLDAKFAETSPAMLAQLKESWGPYERIFPGGPIDFIVQMIRLVLLIFVTLTYLFQGGMALFYHRRKAIVAEALSARNRVAAHRG